jgi:hypothetical protein
VAQSFFGHLFCGRYKSLIVDGSGRQPRALAAFPRHGTGKTLARLLFDWYNPAMPGREKLADFVALP